MLKTIQDVALCCLLAVSLVCAVPADALACSCLLGGVGVMMPREGSAVPSSARIWLGVPEYLPPENIELLSPTGTAIDYDTSKLELESPNGFSVLVLTPREPLAAGEGYRVQYTLDHVPDEHVFDVTDEVDDEAPPVPEVIDVERDVGDGSSSCGEYRAVGLEFASSDDTLLVALRSDDVARADPPSGNAFDLGTDREAWYGGPCGSSWPGGERLGLRFAAFDVSGNYSGPGEVVNVKRPDEDGLFSCTVTPSARSSAWHGSALAGALALLAYRRRRARSVW